MGATPPNVPPFSVIGGSLELTATVTSTPTALPANIDAYPALTICNTGAVDAFIALGDSAVVATLLTASSIPVPAGSYITAWIGINTYIAIITPSTTTTLLIYQASGPVNLGLAGGSGGGPASSVNVTGGNLTSAGTVTVTSGNLTSAGNVTVTGGNLTSAGNVTVTGGNLTSAGTVEGKTASGSAVTANPLTIGVRGATALPSPITDGQVVNAIGDKYGRLVASSVLRDLQGKQYTTLGNTTETTIVTADASNKLDITRLMLTNTSATAVTVQIRDAASTGTGPNIACPAGLTVGFGSSVPLIQTTGNKSWTAQLSGNVSSVFVSVEFIKAGT